VNLSRVLKSVGERFLINRSLPYRNDLCWCPVCERDKEKTAFVGLWWSPKPDRKLVAVYGLCARCAQRSDSVVEEIERALLNRFPQLLNRLPTLYVP
jgi:hypothetical protein